MSLPNITLISFGYFEKDLLEEVAAVTRQEYRTNLFLKEGHIDLSDFFDATRRQYNGNLLLKHVAALVPPDDGKTLGLFSVDLFIPILTFIFGQAYLNGSCGIASVHRLNNTSYGMDPDPGLLERRFTKEVIHELGHTFGLIHCNNPTCVMRSGTYVEDIDQKEHTLCLKCRSEIGL